MADRNRNVHAVRLRRKPDNRRQALKGQFDYHKRLRLLAANRDTSNLLQKNASTSWDWRGRFRRLDGQEPKDTVNGGSMGAIALSNCHLVLWTGEVSVGSPPQPFTLDFDTGSSDVWIPSAKCDHSCDTFTNWRRYDSSKSSTYSEPSNDENSNMFLAEYVDGENVEGIYAQDVLKLGDFVEIEDQVFGEITALQNFQTCSIEEGVFGLAFSMQFHSFATPISNLATKLRHPIFSLYLDATDDYPLNDIDDLNELIPDSMGNEKHGSGAATGANSEIVFGGVNQNHYEGCLSWHNLGQFNLKDGSVFEGYWDFKLDAIKLGTSSLGATTNMALVDSGSTYLVGPIDAIGYLAEQNQAACFSLGEEIDADPVIIDCTSPFGFDAATIECEQKHFLPLEFVADGISYFLGRDELVDEIETSYGPLCLLRVMGNHDIPGWVLGDTFLNKYYSVYDFVNKRVGFAEAAQHSPTVCDRDTPLDLTYTGEHAPISTIPPEIVKRTPEDQVGPTSVVQSSGSSSASSSKPHQAVADNGLRASQKFGLAAVFLGAIALTLGLIAHRRRRRKRGPRFEEIQCTDLSFDEEGKFSGALY